MPHELNLPWTVDEDAAIWTDSAAVVASDTTSDVAFTVSFDPTDDEDEKHARTVAQMICDRVNAGGRVAS